MWLLATLCDTSDGFQLIDIAPLSPKLPMPFIVGCIDVFVALTMVGWSVFWVMLELSDELSLGLEAPVRVVTRWSLSQLLTPELGSPSDKKCLPAEVRMVAGEPWAPFVCTTILGPTLEGRGERATITPLLFGGALAALGGCCCCWPLPLLPPQSLLKFARLPSLTTCTLDTGILTTMDLPAVVGRRIVIGRGETAGGAILPSHPSDWEVAR